MKEGELTHLRSFVLPLLKLSPDMLSPCPGLSPVSTPLLFAWRLTNPSLYSPEISLALVDSSRAMGNTHQQFVTASVMSWTKKWVKDGSVLYEQGTLAADGWARAQVANDYDHFVAGWFVYGRDTTTIWPVELKDMIAPEEDEVMVLISKLISNTLLTSPFLEPLMAALVEEKENDYYSSLMKSIGKAVRKWGRVPMWGAPFFPFFSLCQFFCFLRKCQKHCVTFHSSCPHTTTITHVHTSTYHTSVCICAT